MTETNEELTPLEEYVLRQQKENEERERLFAESQEQWRKQREQKLAESKRLTQAYYELIKRQGISGKHLPFEVARVCHCGLTKAYELRWKWIYPDNPLAKEELETEVSKIQAIPKTELTSKVRTAWNFIENYKK
jgi:hypothetical protein